LVSELLGVYALDACDEEESALVELHLEECAECRDEAARLNTVAGWLVVSEAATPSGHLKARIIKEADTERTALE
jgi:predicted anti-sigma-YlaC factor YlaD